jgi:hypothetical protein
LRRSCLMLLAIGVVGLFGCGGGASSGQPFAIQSGNWSISGTSTAAPGNSFFGGGGLSQSGNNVSGVLHFLNAPCIDGTDIPVSGSVAGQKVTLASPAVLGEVVTVNASGSATALSGTYTTAVTGPDCIGASNDQGTISAALVPSITGTWHGSFTSLVSGSSINATANLTQSATPGAHGFFFITGTLGFTGSPCFTSGQIESTPTQSSIAGSAVGLTITTNDQPTPGLTTFNGTVDVPSAANSISGSYTVRSGNCAVDVLTGRMTRP